jgi:hypothetical protein
MEKAAEPRPREEGKRESQPRENPKAPSKAEAKTAREMKERWPVDE